MLFMPFLLFLCSSRAQLAARKEPLIVATLFLLFLRCRCLLWYKRTHSWQSPFILFNPFNRFIGLGEQRTGMNQMNNPRRAVDFKWNSARTEE